MWCSGQVAYGPWATGCACLLKAINLTQFQHCWGSVICRKNIVNGREEVYGFYLMASVNKPPCSNHVLYKGLEQLWSYLSIRENILFFLLNSDSSLTVLLFCLRIILTSTCFHNLKLKCHWFSQHWNCNIYVRMKALRKPQALQERFLFVLFFLYVH